jgi:O-antigen/teichoic acid export membrane protein
MKRFGLIVIKNAAANVVRGGATAAVALTLPHFLTRSLSPDRFGAWSLMLQISACASYLDFGLQTAVARHLVQMMEGGEDAQINEMASTALAMLAAAGALAFAAIGAVLWRLPVFFHGIPPALLHEFRLAALLLAVSTCAQLPLSAYSGVLTGLHRNEFPALAIGGSRLAGGVAAVAVARFNSSLVLIAVCVGAANLLGGLAQIGIAHRVLRRLRLSLFAFDWKMAEELGRYCIGLTVWSFGVFFVNGMDLIVVGHFQFKAVGYYSVATALITCFVGFGYAIINAFMTPIAALHAHGEFERIRNSVLLATRWIVVINAALMALIFAFGEPALTLWVGSAYAQPAFYILRILVVAQAIRFTGAVFCVMLIATGQQHHGIEGAVVEAIVSLCSSLVGAICFGPVGVAVGTLAGTTCGLLWIVMRTMPRAQAVPLARRDYVIEGILVSLLFSMPIAVCAFTVAWTHGRLQGWILPSVLVVSGVLILHVEHSLPMCWRDLLHWARRQFPFALNRQPQRPVAEEPGEEKAT